MSAHKTKREVYSELLDELPAVMDITNKIKNPDYVPAFEDGLSLVKALTFPKRLKALTD